jgi:hypothetical protein
MTTSARSSRLVSGVAVAAVTIAALGAVVSSRIADQADQRPASASRAVQAQRPAADETVRVVKAPAEAQPMQQPAGCRDCGSPRVLRGRL